MKENPLALVTLQSDLEAMKTHRIASDETSSPAPATAGDRLRVVTVPGLIERGHQVIRNDDDSDEDYERSRELFALVISSASSPWPLQS